MKDMIPPSEITRKGCPLRFWLTGPEERPLIVFTHGAGVDHREWEGSLSLVAQNYRVLCWDVRGHGQSRPTSYPFTLERATDDLLALLDAVGANQAILVGHSMGGNISQEVIFRAPGRVQAAVLLGCTSNTQRLSLLEQGLAYLIGPLLEAYPYTLLRYQSAYFHTDRTEVRAYLYEAFGQMSRAEFKAVIPQLLSGLHEEPGYQIPVPFLLLHGEHDIFGNIRIMAQAWARTEPCCEYAIVPRAGHMANMDNPQAFNQLLLDFLHRYTTAQ